MDPTDVGESKNTRVCGWRYISVERERADIVMGSLTHVKWVGTVVLSPCHTRTKVQTVITSGNGYKFTKGGNPTVCLGLNMENQAFRMNNKVNLAFKAFAANRSVVLLIHYHNYHV